MLWHRQICSHDARFVHTNHVSSGLDAVQTVCLGRSVLVIQVIKRPSLKKCFWKDHLIQAECFPSGCWCPGVSRVFLLRMLTEHWTQKSSTKPYKAASIPISRAIRAHSTFTFHQGRSHFNEWFFIPSLYFIAIWRKLGWISAWLAQTSRRIWVGLIPDKHLSFSHVSSVLTPPLEQCVYRGPGEAGGMWTTPAMCEDNGWP